MTPLSARLKRNLKQRTEYLVRNSALPGRSRLENDFLRIALSFGRVGLIGGAIRDLAFQRSNYFKSDLDFVIQVEDRSRFEAALQKWKPEKTSFGGYRMTVGALRVDFWEATKSWAHLHKHTVVSTLDDVRNCTFFNLDAVIYDIGFRKLIVDEGVLEAFLDRKLDINLRPNPNEDGAAVRALRRLWTFDLYASQSLIQFMSERIASVGWASLVDRDSNAFPQSPILSSMFEGGLDASTFADMMQRTGGRIPRERQTAFKFVEKTHAA